MLYISTFQCISGSPKQPVVHDDVYGPSNGSGTLTVTAKSDSRKGLWGESNYNDNGTSPSNSNPSVLAADGYTVTRSDMTNNGDGSYTWTYTVAPTS